MVYVLFLYVRCIFFISPNISYKVLLLLLRFEVRSRNLPLKRKIYTKNCNSPLKILFTTKAAAPTSCACLPK